MLSNNEASEQLDVEIAQEKETIRLDSTDHVIPAYRYALLNSDELEALATDLKQSEQQKVDIIASPALYTAETRLQAIEYLNAIRVNIASIAAVIARQDIANEEV